MSSRGTYVSKVQINATFEIDIWRLLDKCISREHAVIEKSEFQTRLKKDAKSWTMETGGRDREKENMN